MEEIKLVICETIMKSCSRSKRGIILKLEIKHEDYTATMACLPLDEPMTLSLSKMEVGV